MIDNITYHNNSSDKPETPKQWTDNNNNQWISRALIGIETKNKTGSNQLMVRITTSCGQKYINETVKDRHRVII